MAMPDNEHAPESATGEGSRDSSGIYAKMLGIMNSVAYIRKDKRNEHFKYTYASEAAIKERLHDALVKNGVLFLPEIVEYYEREIVREKNDKKNTETLTTIVMSYRFVDVETEQYVTGKSYGCGIDPGDKGLYKAITGAIKYIMTSTFLIATGDDPEEARQEEREEREEPKRRTPREEMDARFASARASLGNLRYYTILANHNYEEAEHIEDAATCAEIYNEMKDAWRNSQKQEAEKAGTEAPKQGTVTLDSFDETSRAAFLHLAKERAHMNKAQAEVFLAANQFTTPEDAMDALLSPLFGSSE